MAFENFKKFWLNLFWWRWKRFIKIYHISFQGLEISFYDLA